MSDTAKRERMFGQGPLSAAASLIYTLLVVELLFLFTTAPGLVGLVLLDHDASNLPLAAVCAVPVGPAVSAALYALRQHRADLADLRPAAAFWRGYRLNVRGVMLVWVPLLVWLTIIGVSLTHRDAGGVPGWWTGMLIAIGVCTLQWGSNALVITSLFTFRARDVARLGAYFVFRTPAVTVGNLCLLAIAAGVTAVSSEAVLALLGSMFTLATLLIYRPMTTRVQKEFTHG